ncbi:hypothetical protein M0R19_00110 [Candidatus Pacearchaeota archaeon]|nr:hypothetical protein [Candidatus Pacearchaeota archaeon]
MVGWNFYLGHPKKSKERVRKWELEFEERTGINLINPFYDDCAEDKEMKKVGAVDYATLKSPDIVIDADLRIIKHPSVRGSVFITDKNRSIGTFQEMVYNKMFGKEAYSIITSKEENHPWLRYHSDKIFLNFESFEEFIVGEKKKEESFQLLQEKRKEKFGKSVYLIDKVFSRDPKTIKTKEECYALYQSGFFGNKPLTWNSYEEIIADGWLGKVSMRSKKGAIRTSVKYKVPVENIQEMIKEMGREGVLEKEITFNESMPDDYISIQGEITRNENGLCLFYSTLKEPMNIALKQNSSQVEGLRAKIMLQNKISNQSYEDLMNIMDMFPNDIVEFSSWTKPVGLDKKDTIIWEVRNY